MARLRLTKTNKILLVAVAAVLVLGGFLYIVLTAGKTNDQEIANLLKEVRELQDRKKVGEAEAKVVSFLDAKQMTDEQQYQVTYLLGAIYQDQAKFQEAYDTYLKAAEVSPGGLRYLNALGIAQAADGINKDDVAIDYYKRTIELARIDPNPVHATFIPTYERIIKILENPGDPSLQNEPLPEDFNRTAPPQ